jgi:hypothetical protein
VNPGKIQLRLPQATVFHSDRRFRVLVAGRRFGKTYLALTELCRAAWGRGRLAWYVAPTYRQAKRIAWKPLKQITRPFQASKPNESDLSIELTTGGTSACAVPTSTTACAAKGSTSWCWMNMPRCARRHGRRWCARPWRTAKDERCSSGHQRV